MQYSKTRKLTQKKQVLCDLRVYFLIFNCQTPGKAYAMSANYAVSERIKSGEGKVVDVKETPKGYFVTVEFDE